MKEWMLGTRPRLFVRGLRVGALVWACVAGCGGGGSSGTGGQGGAHAAGGAAGVAATGQAGAGGGGRASGLGGSLSGGAGGSGVGGGVVGGSGVGGSAGGAAGVGGAGGGIACSGSLPNLPDFTRGSWLICNALDTAGKIWTGTLTFATETPTCDGAALTGTFHWITTNIAPYEGTTNAVGTYKFPTQLVTLDEMMPTGSVTSGTDYMTYDPANDRFVNGSWTCSCPAGTWASASRQTTSAPATCP